MHIWPGLAATLLLASACVAITPTAPDTPPASPLMTPVTTSQGAPAPTAAQAPKSNPPSTDAPTKPARSGNPSTSAKPSPSAAPSSTAPRPWVNTAACTDRAYTLEGFSWNRPFYWYFNSASTPNEYEPTEVVKVLKRAFDNVTSERNDCGRPDTIVEQATYEGDTRLKPCPDTADGVNVVGFGTVPADLSVDAIAYTCPYKYVDSGKIAEADITIGNDVPWALSMDGCVFAELLEPTITHEVGHVLGLGHISERKHGDLTMSTKLNGMCEDDESTLGLGDMLGLESLYAKP